MLRPIDSGNTDRDAMHREGAYPSGPWTSILLPCRMMLMRCIG